MQSLAKSDLASRRVLPAGAERSVHRFTLYPEGENPTGRPRTRSTLRGKRKRISALFGPAWLVLPCLVRHRHNAAVNRDTADNCELQTHATMPPLFERRRYDERPVFPDRTRSD